MSLVTAFIVDSNPDIKIPLGFADGLHDRELGFVRFGFRDYDTYTSRWTAPDPIGDAGRDFLYARVFPFCSNDAIGPFSADWKGPLARPFLC